MKFSFVITLLLLSSLAHSQVVQCVKGGGYQYKARGNAVTVTINGTQYREQDSNFDKMVDLCNGTEPNTTPSSSGFGSIWGDSAAETATREIKKLQSRVSIVRTNAVSLSNTPDGSSDIEVLFDIQYPEVGINGCDSVSYCGQNSECTPKTCEPNHSLDQNGYCVKDVVPCPLGEVRIDGICHPENEDDEDPVCGSDEILIAGQCVPNEDDNTCPAGQIDNADGNGCVVRNYLSDIMASTQYFALGSNSEPDGNGAIGVYPPLPTAYPGIDFDSLNCKVITKITSISNGSEFYSDSIVPCKGFKSTLQGYYGPGYNHRYGVQVYDSGGNYGPVSWYDFNFLFDNNSSTVAIPQNNPMDNYWLYRSMGQTWVWLQTRTTMCSCND